MTEKSIQKAQNRRPMNKLITYIIIHCTLSVIFDWPKAYNELKSVLVTS